MALGKKRDRADRRLTLAQVYHVVLKALDATPERAKAEVVEKWRTGQLLLYCEHKEYRPRRPDIHLAVGEQPPPIEPEIKLDHRIGPSDRFDEWNWLLSYAVRRDPESKSLFRYENIYAWSANVNALWSTATDRDVAKPARRKPGRSPKHNWPTVVAAELIRLVHEEGIPNNDSKVADRLSQVCQDRFQWQPADSEIRKLVADLLRPVRGIPANSS